jgi:hypothetical protein
VVLNICDRIGVRVPVDLSILVTWRIVTFVVVGGARACQNFEMSGLLVQPAYTKTFTLWPYLICVHSLMFVFKLICYIFT